MYLLITEYELWKPMAVSEMLQTALVVIFIDFFFSTHRGKRKCKNTNFINKNDYLFVTWMKEY